MPRRRRSYDTPTLTPPAEYRRGLEQLDQLLRLGKGHGRAAGTLRTKLAALRESLTLAERVIVDHYGDDLNTAYRQWLAGRPEERLECRRIADDASRSRRRPLPTGALPGSAAKVEEIESRRRNRLDLYAPGDAGEELRLGLRAVKRRNGSAKGATDRGAGLQTVMETAGGFIGTTDPPSRLRLLRERAGLTRKALARRARLSLRCVTLLESGQRRFPRPETLAGLADALRVSVDAVLGRKQAGPAGVRPTV